MKFDSLEKLLTQLEKQPGWENFRDYRQLLQCWHKTVNGNTATNTRPLYIARQVLFVATNSAARAQELSFQRHTLLKRLNKQLPYNLKDIRFSASGWQQKSYLPEDAPVLFKIASQHRSPNCKNSLRNTPIPENKLENTNREKKANNKAKAAVERWLNKVSENTENLSLLKCSHCGTPTPSGEIERWNSCYLCIAQKWSQEYRPSIIPKSE